ncbi:MAG: ABC transporter permease [Rhodoferax sp.]|uniref:ABC transporter permease n=1 Tax=Rhodoferax sp. TaxID=50421 RepID=UPI002ACD57B0|nr:ABC transporter permease [Rhodoferax sp.]MDZ7893295.1 ABC transporter permease [Rhodoferax sp.]
MPAWAALWHHPQTWPALGMTLWTGLCATLLSTVITASILSRWLAADNTAHRVDRWARWMSPLLSVPHAAFAIGMVALIAPGGWLLRAASPWLTGLENPPAWATTQDPWGLGLIAVLVLKEVPFLLWAALAHLQQPGVQAQLRRSLQLAATWGYTEPQAWWRVGWPPLAQALTAPLLAVLAYSLTVVDMALVIGPTTPPTLSMLAWQWLQDADAATNAQGASAAWLLLAALLACTGMAALWRAWPLWRARRWRGVSRCARDRRPLRNPISNMAVPVLLGTYGAVLAALAVGSVSGPWPFPQWLPEVWTLRAWDGVVQSSSTVWLSMALGAASAGTALVWVVAWLEWAPPVWQQRLRPLWLLPLVLPAVLWVVGLHRVSLAWGIDGSVTGLWLAHTLSALPYVLIALQGPYGGFDPRLAHLTAALGRSPVAFLWQVKWPLLRSALAAAFAVGFAVSVAQYLPTLYVGAGRFQTVTTEAVTLASGGQRALTAAYAWLQWLLPMGMFGLAAWSGRARRWPAAAQ